MRIGILVGVCGLAVAAATQADIATTTRPVEHTNVEDRSVDALHRAIGAPGSIQRDNVVRDLRTRVMRGEISPFKVLLNDAIPDYKVAGVGEFGHDRILGGELTLNASSRGVSFASFDDDFSTYPLSDDPIFGRFNVNMANQINPSGEDWDFAQSWYIPSLFVPGQIDPDKVGVADPLPRWQGVDVIENEDLGQLAGDIVGGGTPGVGDGKVDSADLGVIIANFGTTDQSPNWQPAYDINGDNKIDTADLGIILSQFNMESGPFCVYEVDAAQAIDTDGFPLNPATVAAGPAATQTIAILNGTYNNDANVDGCPDCAFFAIETDGAFDNQKVYGEWTLLAAMDEGGTYDFRADVNDDTCSGWGSEAVLADARGETDIIENQCCFLGARTTFPLFAPTPGQPLVMEVDCFYTTLDTFQWVDTTSSVEGFTVTRTFMGGYAPSLSADFLKFSTGGDGYMNHFVFLGNLPGVYTIGQFYGTAPDPLVGNAGVEIKTGEWFTLSYRLTNGDVSIWLKDSETTALVDASPGDDGSGTPFDGSDDLEDGFAKIFPTGPFGISPGVEDGQVPQIPQPPLAAISMDTFRFLWSGDPTGAEVPGYEPHNIFYDNIHVEGNLFPVPELPKFALNYLDNIETYFGGGNLALMGGRWFDAQSSRAIIDDFVSASGDNSIFQDNPFGDGMYRNEFETDLPLATASGGDNWTAGVTVLFGNTTCVRGIRLGDDVISQDPSTATVARLLSGVANENGNIILDTIGVNNGSTRIHMRVNNPSFDPNIEESPTNIDQVTDLLETPNPRFINVPTTARTEATELNTFRTFTFEVDAALNLVVRKNGALVSALNTGGEAVAVGYEDPNSPGNVANGGGWVATSSAVDEMSFESGNQPGGTFVAFNVDDVTLNGFGPITVAGPEYALPYADDFEDYPVGVSIDGQGDTPFVDGASIVDTNLCIEQGLQALNYTTSDSDDWCEYMIKSDAIGGIASGNDWGLNDGDLIWVRQADCGGPVNCKDLQCFTNPNRPDEFFPNVGLFDDPDTGTKAAAGARVEFVMLRTAFDPPDTVGVCDTFEWDTYDPTNLFGKYEINTIADADEETAGQQNVATPSLAANTDYYNNIGGKVGLGSIIAVDQIFATDTETGLTSSPGVVDVENLFKIVDPCEVEILTGTWTYLGDGNGEDDAQPLDCSDVPHFNFVFDGFPRYQGAGINTVDDPAAAGFGQCIRAVNLAGFGEGGSYFIDLRSTYPDAFAVLGTDCVFEVDVYVTDNKSRYSIDVNGPNGTVTEIQLGGPDNDVENSPGTTAVPATNFALHENNPGAAGPFGMGPDTWFYDTNVAVPLNAWFRLRVTVAANGSYTVEMDQSGTPGGDGTFETAIASDNPGVVNGASGQAGVPLTPGANAVDGLDTNTGLDEGGTGTFLRDPITVKQDDVNLPGANAFPDDFCFYRIDDIDGISLGVPPAPCGGVFELSSVLGLLRNAGLPNWPDGGNVDVCPESQEFIWQDAAMSGTCTGEWVWVDPDDEGTLTDFPGAPGDVTTWANYVTIPAFSNPGQPSSWYFDNVSLDGSETE